MNTATDKTALRISKGCFRRPRTWIIAAVLAFILWFVTPSSWSAGGVRFTVHRGGSPGAITFVVRDSTGQLLQGVTVSSESFSGTTQEFVTEASGIATIRPGESEVLAVYIQGHEFRFRPRYTFLEHFAPDCSGGLTLNVSIQNDRNA